MITPLACLLATGAYWTQAAVLPEVMGDAGPMARGVLTADTALVLDYLDPRSRFAPVLGNVLVLLRRPLQPNADTEFFDFGMGGPWFWPSRGPRTPHRWQLGGGLVYYAPLVHLPKTGRPLDVDVRRRLIPPAAALSIYPYTAAALAPLRVADPGGEPLASPQRYQAVYPIQATMPSAHLDEFVDLFNGLHRTHQPLPPEDQWRAHFDFLINSTGTPELYVIAPGRFYRYDSALGKSDRRPEYRWTPVGTYTPGWDGPFYVTADGGDRHFVAPGGRVFTLPADAKPGSVLVKTWDGDPILALVHDADAGKSYAFTRTRYFHVTSKPDPKPHALKAFPGATGEEALDTVARCGRVIRGIK